MSIADEIEKLNRQRQAGAISEEEYARAKNALLGQAETTGQKVGQAFARVSSDANQWSMFIHLAQFCGFLIPFAGFIVPIVLWQVKKNDSEVIDRNGRIVANWIITEFILSIVFALLCFVCIGIPLLMALAVAGLLFPIIGGIKANDGKVWPYPLSIRFFSID